MIIQNRNYSRSYRILYSVLARVQLLHTVIQHSVLARVQLLHTVIQHSVLARVQLLHTVIQHSVLVWLRLSNLRILHSLVTWLNATNPRILYYVLAWLSPTNPRKPCSVLASLSPTNPRILYSMLAWLQLFQRLLCFIHFHISLFLLVLTLKLTSAHGTSHEFTSSPGEMKVNVSEMIDSLKELTPRIPPANITQGTAAVSNKGSISVMEQAVADGTDIPRDSPAALVIASSIAAVCILVFFVIAYLWHTHQLDSRARKLAIRLAADAEHGLRCRNCGPRNGRGYPRSIPRGRPRNTSESSQEQNQYAALTPDEDRGGVGSDGGRSSVGASESDGGDLDAFEPIKLSQLGERSRNGSRAARGAHKKWSRTRKTSSGSNLDKRDSAVTDKEILTHFASRRHSTFFI